MNNDISNFDSMPVSKAVLKNAIPAMVSMIMVLIYNVADTFFISLTRDPLQVAAVSIATPIFLLSMAIGTLFGVGGTSVISRAFGEGKSEYAKKVSSFCFWASLGVGVVFMAVVWLFMDSILVIIGTSPDTIELARSYLVIVTAGAPFVVIANCHSNIIRAEGLATKAMIGMLIGNLLNVILDPIFILALDMGVAGAAIATVIGNVVGALYYLLHFLRKKSSLSINPKDFKTGDKICSGVLGIGIPASLTNILMSFSNVLLNGQMAQYGDLPIAAIGVATKVSMVAGMVQIGLGQGVQPLLGYSYGAGNRDRFKKTLRFSLIFSTVLGTVLTTACYIWTDGLVGIFLEDAAAFDYAVTFTRILLSTGFVFGVLYVLTNALQAIGAAIPSLILSISRQGIVYIPMLFILGAVFGMNGLVATQPAADFIALALAVILYLFISKKAFSNMAHKKENDTGKEGSPDIDII